ncbi:hypothetical protein O6H91_19G041800 [Diphasiastrum complanatum]|uniref:Uncharacterized protein n=1 Tax=Diphasiastrum complanatum TaxID=34168 RepID=A0ACC2AUN4_DIPCM|nr:hypothetical protein O6H91_19G041800 [Diphasiastrum complanatum]
MTVEFVTIDGEEDVSLKVRVFRPDDTELKELVIVLVHQYTFVGGNQGLVKGLANELAAKGYVCVTFDMRGAGRSTGRPSITGTAEVQDVVTVCRWAASHLRAPRILVSGTSVGQSIVQAPLYIKSHSHASRFRNLSLLHALLCFYFVIMQLQSTEPPVIEIFQSVWTLNFSLVMAT